MTIRINRTELLHVLELCGAGTASREVLEQSACVVFRKGQLITFNDEISCRAKGYDGLNGAVRHAPLKNILGRMADDVLTVEQTDTHLMFKGKRSRLGVVCEQKIMLPLKHLERPTEWRKLPPAFIEGIKAVKDCAGTDDSKFALTCIHIHPQYVETFDDYKYARYLVKTGISEAVLVRQSSIKHIETMAADQISESDRWIHFKNSTGFVLSCRKYSEEYPNLDVIAKASGAPVTLPSALAETARRAGVFSVDSEDNQVEVTLQSNRIVLKGTGQFGWYSETHELKKYRGPSFHFKISPQMLEELLTKYRDCQVSDKALIAGDQKFRYVTSVMDVPDEVAEAAPKAETNGAARKRKAKAEVA
jgi:DNA polymerase III sliding clamp (beta) subunit (PCNA family)